jgi:hypothetical protein
VAIPASGGKSRKQETNNQPVRAEIELERSTNSFPNYSTLNTDLSATQINLLPTLHESHKALQNQHAASVSVGRAAIVAQQRPPERIDQCRNAIGPSRDRSLSGLMLPAESCRTATLDGFQRSTGCPPCQSDGRSQGAPTQPLVHVGTASRTIGCTRDCSQGAFGARCSCGSRNLHYLRLLPAEAVAGSDCTRH